MTQEALKELLEAVEQAIQAGDWKVDGACDPDLAIRRAKEALAQPEQEPVAWKPIETAPKDVMILVCLPRQMNLVVRAWYNSIHNFWQTDYEGEGGITRPMYFHEGDLWHPIPPLYTTPPQRTEQEPVALETLLKWDDDIDPIGEVVGFIEGSPYIMVKVHKGKQVSLDDDLYATPPQRSESSGKPSAWVGLTDEEIQECYSEAYKIVQGRQLEIAFSKAIEAKLKLKNGFAEENT